VLRRIALTGGIATGKSHVRALFDKLGVPTIDSDVLARQAVAPGTPGLDAVIARFGRQVLDQDGGLDRRKLGAIVFADPAARHDLESIVHPFVRGETDRWFASLDPRAHAFAIADIPLLYEVGRQGDFDAVIVAACEPHTQVQRVMKRDGLDEPGARQRIAAQLPIEEKVRLADHVIRTDGTLAETESQVQALHARLIRDSRANPAT
jgi:dephospho-CoA kinase